MSNVANWIYEWISAGCRQISTEFWGNFQELKHELKSSEKFMKRIKKMYLSKTEIPEKKFKRLMRKDLYLTPSKCLKYKIVDCVD